MECVVWSDAIATMMDWRVYGRDHSLECCFPKTVVTMKVSDIASHIPFQTSNQPSLLIDYSLFICCIVQVCGTLECFLRSDGNATMMQWRVTCKILWWRLAYTECIWMSNVVIMPVMLHMTWLHSLNCDWHIKWSEVFLIVQVYFFIATRSCKGCHFVAQCWAPHERNVYRRWLQWAYAIQGVVSFVTCHVFLSFCCIFFLFHVCVWQCLWRSDVCLGIVCVFITCFSWRHCTILYRVFRV